MTTPSASGLWLPENISTHGAPIDQTIILLHWFMGILFVGWGLFFLYCLVRYRKGAQARAVYEGSHSKLPTFLEVGVLVVEVVLLVGFSMPIWAKYKNAPPPEDQAMRVHIIAQQFAWNIHYPGPDGKFGRTDPGLVDDTNQIGLDRNDPAAKDDLHLINQLFFPEKKPIIATITSLDVIHSFWILQLRVKQDAVPGMSIDIWWEATKTGDYEISCAQLCGLGHYRMRGSVGIKTQADFDAWMKTQQDELAAGGGGYE